MKTPTRNTLPGIIVASVLITPCFAAVALVDTFVDTSTVDGLSYTINGSTLDFTNASKLVVTVGSEGNSSNGAAPAAISSLSYGGIALSAAVATTDPRSNVWYVDLTGKTLVGTNFQLEFVTGGETNRGYGFSAYTLSGTADGVSSTGQGPTAGDHNFTTINPPTAGEFVIASYSRNSSAGTYTGLGANLTGLYNDGLDNQYAAASVYGTLASAGSQTIQIDGMNGSGRTVAATFAAIPEPSTTSLLGIVGVLCLLRRRR